MPLLASSRGPFLAWYETVERAITSCEFNHALLIQTCVVNRSFALCRGVDSLIVLTPKHQLQLSRKSKPRCKSSQIGALSFHTIPHSVFTTFANTGVRGGWFYSYAACSLEGTFWPVLCPVLAAMRAPPFNMPSTHCRPNQGLQCHCEAANNNTKHKILYCIELYCRMTSFIHAEIEKVHPPLLCHSIRISAIQSCLLESGNVKSEGRPSMTGELQKPALPTRRNHASPLG